MRFGRVGGLAALVAILATVVVDLGAAPASAVSGSEFDPGYIVSDQQFFDDDAMTAAQIQSFLDTMVPTCHPERSEGPDDPIVCLKDYTQTTVTIPADAYCALTYVGAANESSATIVYKVAQACHVSPRALLVTLQKEQGLVTHTWPSTGRYDRAMGFGCPDSAPCDTQYYGFQNQVWRAARQFQRYKANPSSYNHRAGVTNYVRYHPNPDCGNNAVVIVNQATAGLYNYTPYQPNSAALANMYGTGDSCSSYGNRNFWRYWWDWFGDPTGVDGTPDLLAAVEAAGGVAGPLGPIVTPENCVFNLSTCSQRHQNGTVYWSSASGAFAVLGEYDVVYRAAGGPAGELGSPTSTYIVVDTNPHGAGGGQQFQYGTIYSSAHGAFAVAATIRAAYWEAGGNQGSYGWPTSAKYCSGSSCAQEFQGGVIAYSSSSHAYYSVDPAYLAVFQSTGGLAGELGVPLAASVIVAQSPNGPGAGQQFSQGTIYSSASGAFAVTGAVRTTFWARGSVGGILGWPIAGAVCSAGTCEQRFQGGFAFSNGLVALGGYADAYAASGGATGTLGTPVGSQVSVSSPNGAGGGQTFARGTAYSSAAGTYPVFGAIRDEYWARGGNQGSLGWPIANPVCEGGLCRQEFQGGVLAQWSVTATPDSASIPAGGAAGATATVDPAPGSGSAYLQYLSGSTWVEFASPLAVVAGQAHLTWTPSKTFTYRFRFGTSYSGQFTITVTPPAVTAVADSASIPAGGAAGATATVAPAPSSGSAYLQYLSGSTWVEFAAPVAVVAGQAHLTWTPSKTFTYRFRFGSSYSDSFTITVTPPTVTAAPDSASIPGGGTAGATATVSPAPGSGSAYLQYLSGSTWVEFASPVAVVAGQAHLTWTPSRTFTYRFRFGSSYSSEFTITVTPPTVIAVADAPSIPPGGTAGATATIAPAPGSGSAYLQYLSGSTWVEFASPVAVVAGQAHLTWTPSRTFTYRFRFGSTYSATFVITVVPTA